MQTFLPCPSFRQSAHVLDWRRLGKQRVEAKQLIGALQTGGGWANHPAAKMWRGHVPALKTYHDVIIEEWIVRGFKNNMPFLAANLDPKEIIMPPWFGDDDFHASHRSNLLRKDPEHYGKFGWTDPTDLPYVWPTTEGE